MSRLKFFSASLAIGALIACGQAGDANLAVAQDGATHSDAKAWTVVKEESHLKFTAKQEGKDFEGLFETFDADIVFDPADLTASRVTVTVPLDQVDAGSRDRNSSLPDKAWFSTKAFPVATWQSNEITQTGEGTYLAAGELTLKGISKPLNIPFSLVITDKAVMDAQLSFDRTDWDVGTDPWNTEEWVSRSVNLDIQVVATQ
jgi:polyisoprenoid-binding protein YceI